MLYICRCVSCNWEIMSLCPDPLLSLSPHRVKAALWSVGLALKMLVQQSALSHIFDATF